MRIGAISVSSGTDETLVSIGLGSCIGLALVAADRPIAGLAHVMLPSSATSAPSEHEGKFADLAVPRLLEQLTRRGARRSSLSAALVGGAQMFSCGSGSSLDIGARNEQAVREALGHAGIPVLGAATGGSTGRTIRVEAATGRVTVREAGGPERELLAGRAA